MTFLTFRNTFHQQLIFSLNEISKYDQGFLQVQLNQWQNKGYIKKIINGWYIFSDKTLDENKLCIVSNRVHIPSYVSLEFAFRYYDLIPEGVFQMTCVSTKKTTSFETHIGYFQYRKIATKYFFGYKLVQSGQDFFLLAYPEKAIIDYFYLNPQIKNEEQFYELRFNQANLRQILSKSRLNKFLSVYESELQKRVLNFVNYILNT